MSFVAKLLVRSMVWYLDGRNGNNSLVHLVYLENDTYESVQRLEEIFTVSLQALRLFMFQVSILRLVSKGISSCYGYPSAGDNRKLFEQTQKIYAVKDWDVYLRICEYPLPVLNGGRHRRFYVCKMLKRAICDSQRVKYHMMPYLQHQLYYWRSMV